MWQTHSDWLSFLASDVVPIFGLLGYFSISAHILIDGDLKEVRTLYFAGVTVCLGFYFLVELCANLSTPPYNPTPEIWNKLWCITGLYPSLFWYRMLTLLVSDRFKNEPFWFKFHTLIWRLYLVLSIIFLITGWWHIEWYHTDFVEAGPYYGFYAAYVLSSMVMALVVLIQSWRQRKKFNQMHQNGSLKSFFIGNLCAMIGVSWMSWAVNEGGGGVNWFNQIFHADFVGRDVSQAPGEILLLVTKGCMIFGIMQSNRIFSRRVNKDDWLIKLLLIDLVAIADMTILYEVRPWQIEYLPLMLLGISISFILYVCLLILQHRASNKHFDDLKNFPSDSNGIIGLFKVDEPLFQKRVEEILTHVTQLLKLDYAALIPTSTDYGLTPLYFTPHFKLCKKDPRYITGYDQLQLEIGQPVIGSLMLGPKIDKRTFTQEEEEIARHTANQIASLWQMRSIIIKYNDFVTREITRRDELISEQISILHHDLIGNIDVIAKRLEICSRTSLAKRNIGGTQQTLDQVIKHLTRLQLDIREMLKADYLRRKFPSTLAQVGLIESIRSDFLQLYQEDFTKIEFDTNTTDSVLNQRLLWKTRKSLYACLVEAATNARRHGPGDRLELKVSLTISVLLVEDYKIKIIVRDDGVGFKPPKDGQHYGIAEQAWHLSEVGGYLEVHGLPEGGTQVTMEIF